MSGRHFQKLLFIWAIFCMVLGCVIATPKDLTKKPSQLDLTCQKLIEIRFKNSLEKEKQICTLALRHSFCEMGDGVCRKNVKIFCQVRMDLKTLGIMQGCTRKLSPEEVI